MLDSGQMQNLVKQKMKVVDGKKKSCFLSYMKHTDVNEQRRLQAVAEAELHHVEAQTTRMERDLATATLDLHIAQREQIRIDQELLVNHIKRVEKIMADAVLPRRVSPQFNVIRGGKF